MSGEAAAAAPQSVDWDRLRAAADCGQQSCLRAVFRFPVGVAALVDDGRLVTGCNVENASFGLTLCAECGLVSALHASGGGRLVALVCVDGTGAIRALRPLSPAALGHGVLVSGRHPCRHAADE